MNHIYFQIKASNSGTLNYTDSMSLIIKKYFTQFCSWLKTHHSLRPHWHTTAHTNGPFHHFRTVINEAINKVFTGYMSCWMRPPNYLGIRKTKWDWRLMASILIDYWITVTIQVLSCQWLIPGEFQSSSHSWSFLVQVLVVMLFHLANIMILISPFLFVHPLFCLISLASYLWY